METHHQPQQLNQRKTSVKRCLSPCSEADHEGHVLVSGVKRKTTDPSLLLVQSEYSTDLSQLDTQYKLMVDQRSRQQTDSDTTPTYDPGSPSSSLPSLPSLPTSSSECSQQITPHSSSYSSWTKPIQGKQESDSCEPPSSILDIYSEQIHGPAPAPLVSEVSVRESEADTSKDVSDIESDWDEDLVPSDLPSSDNNISSNNNTRVKQTSAVVISNKRSIFIQPKKIKKFSL